MITTPATTTTSSRIARKPIASEYYTMAYILETISPEDQQKILKDAECNERNRGLLMMRGGHFANNPELTWAINREDGSYLFWAPPALSSPSQSRYYFYFEGASYLLHRDAITSVIRFDSSSPQPHDQLETLKLRLNAAFTVYRRFGQGSDREPPFNALFEEESK